MTVVSARVQRMEGAKRAKHAKHPFLWWRLLGLVAVFITVAWFMLVPPREVLVAETASVSSATAPCKDTIYTATGGESLRNIVVGHYKSVDGFDHVKKVNRLSQTDRLSKGDLVILPCNVPASTQPASVGQVTQTQNLQRVRQEQMQDPIVPLGNSIPATLVQPTQVVANPEPVPAVQPEEPSPTLGGSADVRNDEPLSEPTKVEDEVVRGNATFASEVVIPKTLQKGMLYQIVVANSDLRGGTRTAVFPAVIVSNQDRQGRWRRKDTESVVEKMDDGNWRVSVVIKETVTTSDSAAVIDIGGNHNGIPLSLLAQGAVRKAPKYRKPSKKAYEKLHREPELAKKPGLPKKIGGVILKVGVPSAAAFAMGGIPAAAYAGINMIRQQVINNSR